MLLMKTHYFLTVPAIFQPARKPFLFLLNVGLITATSLATNSLSHDKRTAFQHNAMVQASPSVSCEALKKTAGRENFSLPDQAYWCAGNKTTKKNTPSS
jgi:hypothetical protein